MDNEAILKKIEEISKSREWTMYRLSKESKIAQSTLSSLFNRRANISISKLVRICGAFEMKLSEFFSILEKEQEEGNSCSCDYEMIELLRKTASLSSGDRRLLRSMILFMEEIKREKNAKENGN